MNIRPEVVDLFIDAADWGKYPNLTHESTGKPFSADEVALFGSANWDEVRAARDYIVRVAEDAAETAAGFERIMELLSSYGFDAKADVLHGEMEARMSPADFAEIRDLLLRFGGAE